ncbi:MAG: hypothetical protein O3B85_12395 [Planctomycetota bacterium]|nr:hypothetical protein [Planctomycetota bacterium]
MSETFGAADRRGRPVVQDRVIGTTAVRIVAADGGDALRMPRCTVHDDDSTAAHALEHRPLPEPQTERQLIALVRAPQRLTAAIEIGDGAANEMEAALEQNQIQRRLTSEEARAPAPQRPTAG